MIEKEESEMKKEFSKQILKIQEDLESGKSIWSILGDKLKEIWSNFEVPEDG